MEPARIDFVGLGRALKERGHDVVLHACGVFRGVVEGAGIRFVEVGSEEAYHKASKDPDLWHPRRGFPLVMREGVLDHKAYRKAADRLLRTIVREDGMSGLRAWWIYYGVRLFGGIYAKPPAPLRTGLVAP